MVVGRAKAGILAKLILPGIASILIAVLLVLCGCPKRKGFGLRPLI